MTKPTLRELPNEAILNGPNVRAIEVDDELKELAHSLARQGFLAPIGAVEEAPDTVVTLYGFRRLHAYRWGVAEGLPVPDTVPVLVYPPTLTLVEREAIQLIENLQRKDLTEVEYFQAVKSLQARGLTLEEIGDQVGKSKATVSKWLSPDRCPEEARQRFLAGRLSLGQCYSIATSANPSATLAALLQGATVAAGKRAGRRANAVQANAATATAARVTIPLRPNGDNRSSRVVSIRVQGQEVDLIGVEALLEEALRMVRQADIDGQDIKDAQTGWKSFTSAQPKDKAARKRQPARAAQ